MPQLTFESLIRADATREQIEEWCRGQARSLSVAGSLALSRVLGKYLMYSLAQDSALTPHLAFNGIWEPWVTIAIARHLTELSRDKEVFCLDVGACYGYYSVLMADLVGKDGHVEAWEPIYPDLVQQNADLNGVSVAVIPCAMGTAGGTMYLWRSPGNELGLYNAGGASRDPDERNSHDDLFEVEVKAPSTAFDFDFIKIDVEGAEADVWAALRMGSTKHPVTVCMEFTPGTHEKPESFLQSVVADGFTLGTVGHDGVPRMCSLEEALVPDTGEFRMLWLTRKP